MLVFSSCKKENKTDVNAPEVIRATASSLTFELDVDNHVSRAYINFPYQGAYYYLDMDRLYDEDRNGSMHIANTDRMADTNYFYFTLSRSRMMSVAPRFPNSAEIIIDSIMGNEGRFIDVNEVFKEFTKIIIDIGSSTQLFVELLSSTYPPLYEGNPDAVRELLKNFSKELNDSDSNQPGNQPMRFLVYVQKSN